MWPRVIGHTRKTRFEGRLDLVRETNWFDLRSRAQGDFNQRSQRIYIYACIFPYRYTQNTRLEEKLEEIGLWVEKGAGLILHGKPYGGEQRRDLLYSIEERQIRFGNQDGEPEFSREQDIKHKRFQTSGLFVAPNDIKIKRQNTPNDISFFVL